MMHFQTSETKTKFDDQSAQLAIANAQLPDHLEARPERYHGKVFIVPVTIKGTAPRQTVGYL